MDVEPPTNYTEHPAGLSALEIENGGIKQPKITAASSSPSFVQPKKHKTKVIIGFIVGVVGVILLGSVATALVMLRPKPKTAPQMELQAQTVKTDPATAADTIMRLQLYMNGTVGSASTAITRPVKAEGAGYYTVMAVASNVQNAAVTAPPAEIESKHAAAVKVFSYLGYVKSTPQANIPATDNQIDYVRPDVICQLTTHVPADGGNSRTLEAKCQDIGAYTELSKKQRPFYDAFTKVSASSGQVGFIGEPIITPSASAGYILAKLAYGTVANDQLLTTGDFALYYQTPDQLWHYFKTQQTSEITCDEYKTDELKFAYATYPCKANKPPYTVIAPKKK